MTTATGLTTAPRTLRWLGGGALLLTLALPGVDALAAGIADTRHNLTSTGVSGGNKVTDTNAEICVFCHTPHAANQSSSLPLPLWNRKTTGTTYTIYSTTTMEATAPGTDLAGSTSLACLSCHDGSQAMDTVINKPGFGGYAAGGTSMGLTWTGSPRASGTGGTGSMSNAGEFIAMLGTDLSNDHPIAIPYCGGGAANGSVAGCADKDFNPPVRVSPTNWFVDTGDGMTTTKDGQRQRTDIILYPRSDVPYVECASCHDPHVKQGDPYNTSGLVAGGTFLRISNAGSAVCLACHNK